MMYPRELENIYLLLCRRFNRKVNVASKVNGAKPGACWLDCCISNGVRRGKWFCRCLPLDHHFWSQLITNKREHKLASKRWNLETASNAKPRQADTSAPLLPWNKTHRWHHIPASNSRVYIVDRERLLAVMRTTAIEMPKYDGMKEGSSMPFWSAQKGK